MGVFLRQVWINPRVNKLERIFKISAINNAKMLRNDNPIGLSLAIAANAFFVANSGLSHFAIGEGQAVE
jgi:hypothetical protein